MKPPADKSNAQAVLERMAAELKAALPPAWRPAVDSLDPAGVVILHTRVPTGGQSDA